MLLLLLMISSGCDVNIPGCGKRSLPFFKPVNPPPASTSPSSIAAPPVSAASPITANPPQGITPVPQTIAKQPVKSEVPVEMNVSKATPIPTGTPTATATPQEVEKIAYTTLEQGKPTLWSMNTDGTGRSRLTPMGTSSWYPLWSPNGKILAFLSDMKDGKTNLFVMDKDGSNLKQLTMVSDMLLPGAHHLKPPFSWAPKSDEISFFYRNQVWKINLENIQTETLDNEDSNTAISALEWAPHRDTKYVAFVVFFGGNYSTLMLVNPRLKDELKLASTSQTPIMDISWTSDARDVAYLLGTQILMTASSQTSVPKMILNHPCPELGPMVAYSPSESTVSLMFLAKEFDADTGYRVALLDKASKGPTDPGSLKFLTEPGVDDAVWSPDGAKIAYVQSGDLWIMDSTGANKHRVALIGVQSPCWSKK